ncbi:MAG: cation transporter [Brevinematales bacterium]|jgi:copper chaperone CopZ
MTILIGGMSCGHCVKAVEKALKDLKVLNNIHVENGKATFDAPAGYDTGRIRAAIEDKGYELIGIE